MGKTLHHRGDYGRKLQNFSCRRLPEEKKKFDSAERNPAGRVKPGRSEEGALGGRMVTSGKSL